MTQEVNEILTRKLSELESYGGISADDVLSLESLVKEVSPELASEIRNGIPIHKFTTSRSNINYGEVLVNIKSMLANDGILNKKFNPTDYNYIIQIVTGLRNKLDTYIRFFTNIKGLDSSVIKILTDYRYTTFDPDLDKFIVKEDIEFVDAILNDPELRNLLGITDEVLNTFLSNSVDDITELAAKNNPSDSVHNVYIRPLRIFEAKDIVFPIIKQRVKDNESSSGLIYNIIYNIDSIPNYSITIQDILEIYHNPKYLELTTKALDTLYQLTAILHSSKYLTYIYRYNNGLIKNIDTPDEELDNPYKVINAIGYSQTDLTHLLDITLDKYELTATRFNNMLCRIIKPKIEPIQELPVVETVE